MISFELRLPNQLLVNPRISDEERVVLFELKNEFEKHYGKYGYFLIASSGSAQKLNESVKLIALKVDRVLNSAGRFNQYFQASSLDNWGLVLPEHHVAGLGVKARAFLTGAQVFSQPWGAESVFDFIESHKISFISMVPAQIFDLVKRNIKAPSCLKKVFVGGSYLSSDLREKIKKLNWTVVETYGMTETASMIAVRENNEHFKLLPGIELQANSDFLTIKCDSLLTASLQKISEQMVMKSYNENSWYETQDRVELIGSCELRFLGRHSDYVKILGEGVSLSELRERLMQILLLRGLSVAQFELISVEDERAGTRLILVAEETIDEKTFNQVKEQYNQKVRPYEKIQDIVTLRQIPRTELGKLKREDLDRIILKELKREANG